jgi:hypothetical protein
MKTILLIILLSVWAIVAIVECFVSIRQIRDALERRKIKRMEPAERMAYIAKKYGRDGLRRYSETLS